MSMHVQARGLTAGPARQPLAPRQPAPGVVGIGEPQPLGPPPPRPPGHLGCSAFVGAGRLLADRRHPPATGHRVAAGLHTQGETAGRYAEDGRRRGQVGRAGAAGGGVCTRGQGHAAQGQAAATPHRPQPYAGARGYEGYILYCIIYGGAGWRGEGLGGRPRY